MVAAAEPLSAEEATAEPAAVVVEETVEEEPTVAAVEAETSDAGERCGGALGACVCLRAGAHDL